MENMNLKDVMFKRMQDMFGDLKWTEHLVEDGKDVPAHRKLQGLKAKMLATMDLVKEKMPDNIEIQVDTNVAQETLKT